MLRLFFLPVFFLVVSVFAAYANDFSYHGDKTNILDIQVPDEYCDGNHYIYFLKNGSGEVLNYQVIEEGLIFQPNLLPGSYVAKITRVENKSEMTDVIVLRVIDNILVNPYSSNSLTVTMK